MDFPQARESHSEVGQGAGGRPKLRGQPLFQGECGPRGRGPPPSGAPDVADGRQIGDAPSCGIDEGFLWTGAIYRDWKRPDAHRTAFHQGRSVAPMRRSNSARRFREIRNPDGSVVFRLDDIDVPAQFSQVAADILAQKYFRKAGVPARLKKVEENDVPSFLWRSVPDEAELAKLPEDERYVSETDARQVFDRLAGTWTYWGWKGGYFASRGRRARLPRRARLHARHPARGAELAAMVQHRPALGLWHRRPRPGPFLRRPLHRQADQVEVGLRASAAACLLHPGRRRRPRQRGRHHGSVGARSAPVQIRLRHRLQLLACCAAKAKSSRAAAARPA